MKPTLKKLSIFLMLVLCLALFTGCSMEQAQVEEDPVPVDTKTAVLQCMSEVSSVESNITLELKAHVGAQGSTGAHNAQLGSDITIKTTTSPLAVYSQYFSRMLVDGVATRDDKEFYIVEEEDNMYKYNYIEKTDEWERTRLTKAEAMAVPVQTGLIYDWNSFLSNLRDENYTESVNGKNCYRLSGDVPATLLQEFFGDFVFGTFMHSTEMLLSDMIPCVLYVDSATYYPEQVNLTFTNNWIVSDMVIDNAVVTVNYSSWNEVAPIEISKRIELMASNPQEEFYSTFYAWNLFLPYISNEEASDDPQGGTHGLSFTSDWSTFQVRIDGSLTQLPILYSDFEKIGYTMDASYNSTIIEANQYLENVPVMKGSDTLYCTFYNADAAAQPINSCYIGAIDLSAGNNANAGIQIYLPGEVTLGVTRDALVSAYGDPDLLETAFASDTYTWNGVDENQGFMAEVSPVNNQVIRIYLKNIPVTGGQQ